MVAPSGKLLGSINRRDPAAVAEVLENGLRRWRTLAEEQRYLTDDELAELRSVDRGTARFPDDGLVLEITTRDLPRDEPPPRGVPQWARHAWNRDHAWFTKSEAAAFVPDDPEAGATRAVPTELVARLARLHFVDNVRGQTNHYEREQVELAELTSEVVAVDGERVSLALRGATRARIPDRENQTGRGFETEIRGTAVWDSSAARFVSFEAVAIGRRHGATRFNVRRRDQAPSPVGVVLRLADPTSCDRVTPTAFWEYRWR